jgi:hypothetical protein
MFVDPAAARVPRQRSNFMSRGITDPLSATHSAVVAVEKTIRSQAIRAQCMILPPSTFRS